MGGRRVVVVIPCYNEVTSIGDVVEGAKVFGDVYVVDDGSSDNSDKIASEKGAKIITTNGNVGYDKAIEVGLRAAQKAGADIVITMDADGEHDPKYLEEFIKLLSSETTGLVCGYRSNPQRVAEWFVCKYVKQRFGVRDILCGMKGYSSACINLYFSKKTERNLLNTFPALYWVADGNPCEQVHVDGKRREDTPRFARKIRANIIIFKMLFSIQKIISPKCRV